MSETTTTTIDRAQLDAMSVPELRKLVRDLGLAKGTAVAGASKAQCLALLTGEASTLPTPTLPAAVNSRDLASLIAEAVAPHVKASLDEQQVIDLITEYAISAEDVEALVRKVQPTCREIIVKVPGKLDVNVGAQHKLFPIVLAALSVRVNLALVGPAGSGKSRCCKEAARALGIAYEDMSVGPQTSKSDILGYMDANGHYVGTAFRRAFENGGVFLFDEIDAAHPGVLTIINGATANGHCTFPDKQVARHADCVIIAAANTFGTGADRQYVGRNQLDAATLDRFAMLEFPYDEALEAYICGVGDAPQPEHVIEPRELSAPEREDWLREVRRWRANVDRNGLRHVVSPRAALTGMALLAAGIPRAMVVDMVLAKGLTRDARAKAEAR